MTVKTFAGAVVWAILAACNNVQDKAEDPNALTVAVQAAYHQQVVFQQHGFNGEKTIDLDSAVAQTGLDTFTFHFPPGGERMFTILIKGSPIRVPVINDGANISVHVNYATRRYTFNNSPASEALRTFTELQVRLATRLRLLKGYIDSVKKVSPALGRDSVTAFNEGNTAFFSNYKNFADTVKSPSAFMAVYNTVEFGNDTGAIRRFVNTAAGRFPQSHDVQTLAKNVTDYFEAIEHPYKPGDILPELVLPDDLGLDYSTYSVKGKYVFIDIWATYCDQCVPYLEAVRKATQVFQPAKFQAVSIALDDDRQTWLKMIKARQYTWTQVIDVAMWTGKAFKTLRFDAMPYNFLIGPDGRLIAKNIGKDSVISVIQRTIK